MSKTTVRWRAALLEPSENKKAEQADGKLKKPLLDTKISLQKVAFFAQLAIICEIGLKKANFLNILNK